MGAVGGGGELGPRLHRGHPMRWIAAARERWRALFFGARQDTEMDEELRFHLERETEQIMRDEGRSRRDAWRHARLRFGGLERVREEVREARGIRALETVAKDVRYGVRMLRRRPGFTVVAVLSLAIGIGANTAIFSVVNTILLRGPQIDRPEELVNVYLDAPQNGVGWLSHLDVEDLRDGTGKVFSRIGASATAPVVVDSAERVDLAMAEVVTVDFFALLGIEALLGRTIGPLDDIAPGAHPVVMLGYGYWQSRFGGDPDVVGRELQLAGRAYTVIGVVPADYPGPIVGIRTTLYAPTMMWDELVGFDQLDDRNSRALWVKARLAPGVTLAEAETAVATVAARLTAIRPEGWNPASGFSLVPSADVLLLPAADPYIRGAIWMLMGVVTLLLLLACTNLAGFLLARALDRRREVAVRLALGASRAALVRQLLTESTLLSLLGGGVGLGVAVWMFHLLLSADLQLPFTLDLGLDGIVLAFTLGISVLAGTLLGLIPALQSTRPDVATTLKAETAGGGQRGAMRCRHALVVAQLTVALVILVGAGLVLRSFQQVQTVDPGFGRDPSAILTVRVPPGLAAEQGRQYTRRLIDRIRELPGVDAAGLIDFMP